MIKKYIIALLIGVSINAAEDFNALSEQFVRTSLIALLDHTHPKATPPSAAAHWHKTCKNRIEAMYKPDFIEKNTRGENPFSTLNEHLMKILTECINPRDAALKNITHAAIFEETAIPFTDLNIHTIIIGTNHFRTNNKIHQSYIMGLINTMKLNALVAHKTNEELHTLKPIFEEIASQTKSFDTQITGLNAKVRELNTKLSEVREQTTKNQ